MKFECNIDEIDEMLDEIFENVLEYGFVEELEVESDDEMKIIAYDYKVIIPKYNLYARQGLVLNYSESEQDYIPDFSITLFYNIGEEQYLYWEQDDIAVSLNNFLHTIGRENSGMVEIYNAECIIEIDDKYCSRNAFM